MEKQVLDSQSGKVNTEKLSPFMTTQHIGFNKPYMAGNELEYIRQAVESKKISGDGLFTKKCNEFFEQKYGFSKVLLTTSCTDALELAALLLDIQPGDEVIAPSYTFVSTVNAFILRGAVIRFADSTATNPNMDPEQIEQLITPRTKVLLPVHYAGVACDMDTIMDIAQRYCCDRRREPRSESRGSSP